MLNSSKANTVADGLVERTSTLLDKIASKIVYKYEDANLYSKKKKETKLNKASQKLKLESSEFSREKSHAKGRPSFT